MIKITLPDGSIKKVESGTSSIDIAKDISEGFGRPELSEYVERIHEDIVLVVLTLML